MNILEILEQGIAFTNNDESAKAMLADYKDHKVGVSLDKDEFTIIVKDGLVSLHKGIRSDCNIAFKMSTIHMCDAIDNTLDLMEIRNVGVLTKGDPKDPITPVHLMAIFPYFDAMVRLYQSDVGFKNKVDSLKSFLSGAK